MEMHAACCIQTTPHLSGTGTFGLVYRVPKNISRPTWQQSDVESGAICDQSVRCVNGVQACDASLYDSKGGVKGTKRCGPLKEQIAVDHCTHKAEVVD